MACGTGKTLIGPAVADRLHAKTILVFVPSLLLARQLLNVYRRQWPRALYLAVCSDIDRVATEDAPLTEDIGCSSTTNRRDARRFLKSSARRKVVIATYQSARVLRGLKFDGAVFDEAHRTAGVKGKPFAFGLHDKNIQCAWRLFMTATPRHAEIVSEEGATEEVYSMDDSAVYGPELYKLSFREAIDRGLIVDYRIAVSVFNIDRRPGVTAQQIALRRAMSRYGANKVFTFHNTVAAAEGFIESANALRGVALSHVNGTQPNANRASALHEFAKAEQGIMSNCRCLTEGVDLPSTEMVAFMDTKKSLVEIVQAVGRAMRTSRGKKRAIVFLPIFVREKAGEKLDEAAKRTNFEKLHEVLQALREQDEVLAAGLTDFSTRKRSSLSNVQVTVEGSSSKKVVERIRKYVTVRMLKPFIRGSNKWPTLFRLAREGATRPSTYSRDSWLRSLASFLNHQQDHSHPNVKELRRLRPNWFRSRIPTDNCKKELLHRAQLGERLAGLPRVLKLKFFAYRNEKIPRYDATLSAKILKIAPHWFDSSREHRRLRTQKKLIEMVKDGVRRDQIKPPSLQLALGRYTWPSSDQYDAVFAKLIRRLAPTWFRVEMSELKRTLYALAAAGKPLPDRHANDLKTRSLANAFSRLTLPSSRYRDPSFTLRFKKIAPNWFRGAFIAESVNRKKREIVRLAKSSKVGSKEKVLGAELAKSAHHYAGKKSSAFDPEFSAVLRKIAPRWFRRGPRR